MFSQTLVLMFLHHKTSNTQRSLVRLYLRQKSKKATSAWHRRFRSWIYFGSVGGVRIIHKRRRLEASVYILDETRATPRLTPNPRRALCLYHRIGRCRRWWQPCACAQQGFVPQGGIAPLGIIWSAVVYGDPYRPPVEANPSAVGRL